MSLIKNLENEMEIISHFLNFIISFSFSKSKNVTLLKDIYFKMFNIIFIVLYRNDVISQHVKLSFNIFDSIIG
jgi:hypothetical protein